MTVETVPLQPKTINYNSWSAPNIQVQRGYLWACCSHSRRLHFRPNFLRKRWDILCLFSRVWATCPLRQSGHFCFRLDLSGFRKKINSPNLGKRMLSGIAWRSLFGSGWKPGDGGREAGKFLLKPLASLEAETSPYLQPTLRRILSPADVIWEGLNMTSTNLMPKKNPIDPYKVFQLYVLSLLLILNILLT